MFYLCTCVCTRVWICIMYVLPMEAGRGCWTPWSWSCDLLDMGSINWIQVPCKNSKKFKLLSQRDTNLTLERHFHFCVIKIWSCYHWRTVLVSGSLFVVVINFWTLFVNWAIHMARFFIEMLYNNWIYEAWFDKNIFFMLYFLLHKVSS